MVAVHADDTRLLKDLDGFAEPVEVYDARGKLLGVFVPADLGRTREKYAQLQAMIDWKEIRERGRDPSRCIPHEEVLARLRALDLEIRRRRDAGEKPFSVEEAKAFARAARLGSPLPADAGGNKEAP